MITDQNTVIATIKSHGGEFAAVMNPAYIYPPLEYYPLANRIKKVNLLRAVLMDMDGTTTSTEVLCIHSLEMMVRRMSGLLTKNRWEGVDHHKDLPYIIGNSTTRHVEYLLKKYKNLLQPGLIAGEFLRAARWTLHHGMDQQRKSEVVQNLKKIELSGALEDILSHAAEDELIEKWTAGIANLDFNTQVSLGIDIYYETYHRILALMKESRAGEVRRQVFGEAATDENLISPMPGIPVLIPLLKGWLGDEAGQFAELLISDYEKNTGRFVNEVQKKDFSKTLAELGILFARQPVKIGLVTSSIFYEADVVIGEVFDVMSRVIEQSNLSENRKGFILAAYQDYNQVYDAFVTATDSSEIRLKPHRDLYSIALHKTGLMPADFDKVIGFEDSESGTIAIRAAGIGCCVAVPFAQTLSHNLKAAAHILPGGVPEAIFEQRLFMGKTEDRSGRVDD